MITLKQYLEGRDAQYPPTDEQREDAEDLLEKIALLEDELEIEFIMSGGYRPEAMIEDKELPGCAHDAHSKCQGIDIHDPDLEISTRLTSDPQPLIDCSLFMESPLSAKNHLHLQSYAPPSGKRIFLA